MHGICLCLQEAWAAWNKSQKQEWPFAGVSANAARPVVKPGCVSVCASVLQCARVSCTRSHSRFGVRRRLPLQDLGCKRRRRPSQLVRERRRGQRAMARSTWGAQARSPLSVSARTLLAASLHDHGVACARLPLRSRRASAIFECVLLAGSSLSPCNVIGLGWAYAWVGQSLWRGMRLWPMCLLLSH